mmetsp:Transcript_14843/g.40381  ORF Transcript_14843/g.40381 Transcript_14843/m.40381 type:complete len:102 (+) Transcript_14843:42-347(+)
MPEATSGVLLTCDCPAMKQFVLKVDEEKRSSLADSFVLRDLDDTHLLLRNDAQILALIHRRIDELQDSNSYERVEVDVQSAPPEKGGPAKKKSRRDDGSTV